MPEVLAVSQWECNAHRTAIVDADLVYKGTDDAPSEAWSLPQIIFLRHRYTIIPTARNVLSARMAKKP